MPEPVVTLDREATKDRVVSQWKRKSGLSDAMMKTRQAGSAPLECISQSQAYILARHNSSVHGSYDGSKLRLRVQELDQVA